MFLLVERAHPAYRFIIGDTHLDRCGGVYAQLSHEFIISIMRSKGKKGPSSPHVNFIFLVIYI